MFLIKAEENARLSVGWNVKRALTKINYKINTDTIKENLAPAHLSKESVNILYASEADVLNLTQFV